MSHRSFPPSRLAPPPLSSGVLRMMHRPTPVLALSPLPQESPRDEVCQLATTDRTHVLLVYYDYDGEPSFEWKVPVGFPLMIGHRLLLRLGRWWASKSRRNRMKLLG